MSRLIVVTVGPLQAASANNICLSQTTAGAANLLINGSLASGGVATLDKPRRVLITDGGNDSGITFTLFGTDWNGSPCSEVLQGTSGSTVASTYDYATITRIATSGATSGSGVTVGTNGVASSRPVFLDPYGYATVSLQVVVTGTVNYTIQQTLDDPNSIGFPAVTWVNSSDSAVVAATATAQSNYAFAPYMTRVTLNSGSGSVVYTIIQSASPVKG
jgi:hypothetical protein